MATRRLQYRLWELLAIIAGVALVLGSARGGFARTLLIGACQLFVVFSVGYLASVAVVSLGGDSSAAIRWTGQCARLPLRLWQARFERRLSRLRPGNSSQIVRQLLGSPKRVDGFGDRLYWSYRVAGQRYTVSFDPRRLVATYSNGLAADPRRPRVRCA